MLLLRPARIQNAREQIIVRQARDIACGLYSKALRAGFQRIEARIVGGRLRHHARHVIAAGARLEAVIAAGRKQRDRLRLTRRHLVQIGEMAREHDARAVAGDGKGGRPGLAAERGVRRLAVCVVGAAAPLAAQMRIGGDIGPAKRPARVACCGRGLRGWRFRRGSLFGRRRRAGGEEEGKGGECKAHAKSISTSLTGSQGTRHMPIDLSEKHVIFSDKWMVVTHGNY